MKKRSMILALASMLGISAAATAVSGFAWFTAQTTADIKSTDFYVGAAQGDLKIEKDNSKDVNCTSACENNSMTITPAASKAFADVSSVDGENFYKLKNMITETDKEDADVVAETNKTAGTWMSKVNANQMVAVEWSVTVSNQGGTPAMDVYLSNDGALFSDTVTSHSSTAASLESTDSYVDAYRLAIFDDAGLVFFYSNSRNGLTAADIDTDNTLKTFSTKGWNGTGMDSSAKNATKSTVKVIKNSADTASTDSTTDASNQLLIDDLGSTAKVLKFVVWCEGTDTPEKAVDSLNHVQLSLGLIGLAA